MCVSPSVHVLPEMFKAEVTAILSLFYHTFIKIFLFLTVEPWKLFTLVAPLFHFEALQEGGMTVLPPCSCVSRQVQGIWFMCAATDVDGGNSRIKV